MANLFADGFESGDLTAWSSSSTDGGDLSAATAAKLHGNYGLNCLIDDTTDMYVRDDTPNGETRYRIRFYVDINSLVMANNNEFLIFRAIRTSTGKQGFSVNVKYTTVAGYIIYVGVRHDDLSYEYITANGVTDALHCVEVDWKASSGVGNNDGFCSLWIDGILIGTISNVDNDIFIMDYANLGVIGKPSGTSGTLFLDDFQSNNDGGAIGMVDFTYVGTGEFAYSGEATQTYTFNYLCVANVGFNYSGSAICDYTINHFQYFYRNKKRIYC